MLYSPHYMRWIYLELNSTLPSCIIRASSP